MEENQDISDITMKSCLEDFQKSSQKIQIFCQIQQKHYEELKKSYENLQTDCQKQKKNIDVQMASLAEKEETIFDIFVKINSFLTIGVSGFLFYTQENIISVV